MNRMLQRDLIASLNPRIRSQTHSTNTRWSFLSRGHNLSPLVRCPRVLLLCCCPCYYKKNKRTRKTMTKLKPNSVRALYECRLQNVAANRLIRKLRTLGVHVSGYDTKTNTAVKVHIHALLTSVLLQSEWSASRLGRFTPEVKDGDAHRRGGCAKSSDDLDSGKEQRNCTPAENRIALVQPAVSSL